VKERTNTRTVRSQICLDRSGAVVAWLLSHLAKYRSLVPSLALICHLIECVDGTARGPVSGVATAKAVAWGAYLEAHARRLYASVMDTVGVAAALLASAGGRRFPSRHDHRHALSSRCE